MNWDRSRSPSVERKGRDDHVEKTRKRKKDESKDSKKRSKIDSDTEISEKQTTKTVKSNEQKKKSKTDNDVDEKRDVKMTKSKESKEKSKIDNDKDLTKKTKVNDNVDTSISTKQNVKPAKDKDSKVKSKTTDKVGGSEKRKKEEDKDSKKRPKVNDDVPEKQNIKTDKLNVPSKDGKRKTKVDSNNETLKKVETKSGKSAETKKDLKNYDKTSKGKNDVDIPKKRAIKISAKSVEVKKEIKKKSKESDDEPKQNTGKTSKDVRKKYLRESDDSTDDNEHVKTSKSVGVKKKSRTETNIGEKSSLMKEKLKEPKAEIKKKSTLDTKADETTSKKVSGRTVNSKLETQKKMKSDEDVMKVSERKITVTKGSQVELNNLDASTVSVKKRDVSIVRKCSISDLRDIVNKKSAKTEDEKSSEKNADYKQNENTYASKRSDVLRVKGQDLRDFVQSRKKDDVFYDERKLSGKTKDTNRG